MISDIRHIGNATVILADCLQLLPALQSAGMRFDHAIFDPPYESATHEAKSGKGRTIEGIRELTFAAIDEIREDVVASLEHIVDGWFVAFCTPEGVRPWADAINASSIRYKRACVWVKPDAAPQMNGQCPAAGVEMFVAAWAGAGHSSWNAGGKRGVYTHPIKTSSRDGRHETEKPTALMGEIISDFTKPGDVILDPFMGSGTTGVAALARGRRFVGIELQKKFFDVACERLEAVARQPSLFDPLATVGKASTVDMFRGALA